MRALALRALVGLAVVVGGVMLGLFALQRRLVYHPQSDPVAPPSAGLAPGLQDVRLQAVDGVELHAWYWPAEGPAILFLHGNAGDRSHRWELVRALHARGFAVLALDYRGYGGSGGTPSEVGLYRDAEAAAGWLAERGHARVAYVAESLGTGVAVELAVRRPPVALVLEAPFDGLVEVGRHHFPWLPVRWLLRDRFASAAKIPKVTAPLLVIHGDRDEVVPQARGRALFDAATEPKQWLGVPGAGHNDLRSRMGERYYDAVEGFLRAALEGPAA